MTKTDNKKNCKETSLVDLQGRDRVVIEAVYPEIDHGTYPIQRIKGESITVKADIFADGQDAIYAQLLYCGPQTKNWCAVPMKQLGNDRWEGQFTVTTLGKYKYTLEGWIDPFTTWQNAMKKRLNAGQDVHIEIVTGMMLVSAAAKRAGGEDRKRLTELANKLNDEINQGQNLVNVFDPVLASLMQQYGERAFVTRYPKELVVSVDRERAGYSAWYELFPRSCSPKPGHHGTFKDCETWLPYVSSMNFDVLYLPSIHPIGHSFRKGKNNNEKSEKNDVGSPWAIGSEDGGHKAVHPQLGTLQDFQSFIVKAKEHGLEIALDLAFQCSPDHPYVREHPSFFRKRPDGSIQYAENPPKKYQDIYPFDFETEDWRDLWMELKSIIFHWIEQGVRIFRVDNPHTKSFPFWNWVIAETKAKYPEVIFLGEAFTRPKVMYHLAKLGYTQSYTYFTWRNTKKELTEYLEELTQTEVMEYFRPNFWPNTPDILPELLQIGGRPAFTSRFILAATLSSNYGIYGPAFELCENTPLRPNCEEYLNSEKYELRQWNTSSPLSLRQLITRVNEIRRVHPALHSNWQLHFHKTDHPFLICYSKSDERKLDVILVVVNLHCEFMQEGWVELDLENLGQEADHQYDVHDLLTNMHYAWKGVRNFVRLGPGQAHIFHVAGAAIG